MFPNKVGRDKEGNIVVRFNGEIQKPLFNNEGAAQAFLKGLKDGTRKPEPQDRYVQG